MASIRQYQRRAIEGCRPTADRLDAHLPPDLPLADSYPDETGARLFPWGVSQGYGTCSDVPGMNVLVLGRAPAQRPPKDLPPCAYAVLDEPSEGARRTVELLRPVISGQGVHFEHTRAREPYTQTIC